MDKLKKVQAEYIGKKYFIPSQSRTKPNNRALTLYDSNANKFPKYKPILVNKFVSSLKKDYSKLREWGKSTRSFASSFSRVAIGTKRIIAGSLVGLGKTINNGVDSAFFKTLKNNIITESTRKQNYAGKSLKALRRTVKSLPKPIRKGGILGGAIVGATAMLGLAVMKGAMNESRDIVYERYMQDQAVTKNVLNNTRIGLAAGTSRMQNMGSTIGLSNALSRSRHG